MFGKTLPRNEWLRAAAAFSGIALVSAVSLDLMVTNGWQIDPPPSQVRTSEASPSYIAMMDGGWRSDYSYSTVSWSDPMPIDEGAPAPVERLDGAVDATDPSYRTAQYNAPSEEELYQEIAALYAEQDARAAERAAAQAEEDMRAVETVTDENYRTVSTDLEPDPVSKPGEDVFSASETE